ncbi:hypothetical protein [Clostridium vincentii]|uniref:Peptidase propeptide and YPEB domain protein n=1 Tax=Clostridium vincentii TaxID=52704 RepID=A0A2T0BJ37_9CLOT|nr:hypothetical protein [Clostridium vincentii]PRR83884.1 hypothetical protein CLVI_05380 [Clostridium vincentii]
MSYKSKTIIIFGSFIFLLIGAIISVYVFVGAGSKQIKAAEKFMNELQSNNIITMDEGNNDYKSTKKSDSENKKEYYSITVGDYRINVDSDYNVLGFSNKNSKATEIKIKPDEAENLGEEYLNEIYKSGFKFKEVTKEEVGKSSPYYTIVFSKFENGYAFYSYDLSLNINKETGILDGYSNSSIDKEPSTIAINLDFKTGQKIALEDFSKLYKGGVVAEDSYEAFYANKDNNSLELCYIITIKGTDENSKEIKLRYFISTDTGNINNTEKSNITNTTA